MELLMVVLNKGEYLEKLLSVLVEAGVNGTAIVESEDVGHFLAYEVPIFAGLRQLFGEVETRSKTIFGIIEDREVFSKFEELLKEEGIDFTKPGIGAIITVPVNKAIKAEREE